MFVLDLQTGKVIRSVITIKAFAIFPHWKLRAEPPPPCIWNLMLRYPMPLDFHSKKLPSPWVFQDAAHGRVWVFSGIT